MPLVNGAIFSLDRTELARQDNLWDLRERTEDAGFDCHHVWQLLVFSAHMNLFSGA
jgi:hypothetical protein